MKRTMYFEENPVTIEVIDGVPTFELYSVGIALGCITSKWGSVAYADKAKIKSICANANIEVNYKLGESYITESQVYDFMRDANIKKCKAFRRWLIHDVFPEMMPKKSDTVSDTGASEPTSKTHTYFNKLYGGQYVISANDIALFTGISPTAISYISKSILEEKVDFFNLKGAELDDFKNANPKVNYYIHRLLVFTQSGFEKICRHYKVEPTGPKVFLRRMSSILGESAEIPKVTLDSSLNLIKRISFRDNEIKVKVINGIPKFEITSLCSALECAGINEHDANKYLDISQLGTLLSQADSEIHDIFCRWLKTDFVSEMHCTNKNSVDYRYFPKTYNGTPVLTTADISFWTGISQSIINGYAPCNLNSTVDYCCLDKESLQQFNKENPKINRSGKLRIYTKSGFRKICDNYKLDIDASEIFGKGEQNIKFNEDTEIDTAADIASSIEYIRKQISTVDGLLENYNNGNLNGDERSLVCETIKMLTRKFSAEIENLA